MNLIDLISHLAGKAQQGAEQGVGSLEGLLSQLKGISDVTGSTGNAQMVQQGVPMLTNAIDHMFKQTALGKAGQMDMQGIGSADVPDEERMGLFNQFLMESGALGAYGASGLGDDGGQATLEKPAQTPYTNFVGGSNGTSPSFSTKQLGVAGDNMADNIGFNPGTSVETAQQEVVHANAVHKLLNSIRMTGKLPADTPLSLEEISKILNSMHF